MKEIVDLEIELSSHDLSSISKELLLKAKESGFSDSLLADLLGSTLEAVTELRKSHDILTQFRLVDTCAGEFEAYTPYYYSSYG